MMPGDPAELTHLISEARGYLVVAVDARAAQQLLPDLRGLRQGVKVTFLNPASPELHMAVKSHIVFISQTALAMQA